MDGDFNSIKIDAKDLTKPADTLIKKVSNALGIIFEPYQIKRIAKANADADKIKAEADLEIQKMYAIGLPEIKEIQQRAMYRFVHEETKKQINIENVTNKSTEYLLDSAKPENIDDDWIVNFFDKAKFVSDEQMQVLWSKVLAGEANNPNSFSKRTINFLSVLEKDEAKLFENLCSCAWFMSKPTILIYDLESEIYKKNTLNFVSLKHLDALGLISFDNLSGYQRIGLSKKAFISYDKLGFFLHFPNETNNLPIGKVLLTSMGTELKKIVNIKPNLEFVDYILNYWLNHGVVVSSIYPKFDVIPDLDYIILD